MAERTRVDGAKYEMEIEKAVKNSTLIGFPIRFYTPTGRSLGVRNLCDFAICGRSVVFIESKETHEKSFSLNTFQQKDKFEEYKEFLARKGANFPNYRAGVLIHFMKLHKHVLYMLDEHPFKVIHVGDENTLAFDTLQEAVDHILAI